jgi:DNA-binding MarR family transcriptional regulator
MKSSEIVQIERELQHLPGLHRAEKALLGVLMRESSADGCCLAVRTLARKAGCHPLTVTRNLASLDAGGLVVRLERKAGKVWLPSRIVLCLDAIKAACADGMAVIRERAAVAVAAARARYAAIRDALAARALHLRGLLRGGGNMVLPIRGKDLSSSSSAVAEFAEFGFWVDDAGEVWRSPPA